MIFLEEYDSIEGEILDLAIIEKNPGDEKAIPFYWYNIILKQTKEIIGQISLRIGKNYHSYYNGNIGYYIEEQYRGHRYAYMATLMLYPLSLAHHQDQLYITCNEDNIPSIKTILRLNAKYIETVLPPKDYVYYYDNMPKQNIYLLSLKN